MRRLIMGMVLSTLILGCSAAQRPRGMNTSAPVRHQESIAAGVAATMDDRESETIGTLGGATIELKKYELVDLVSDYLIRYINEKAGLNVERVQINDTDSIKLIASKNKVRAVIILRIKSLKLFSNDVMPRLIGAELTLDLSVFDETGQEVYRRPVISHSENPIESPGVEKNAKELIESVIKNSLSQYGKDAELKKIIAKFKYGGLGATFAQIF